MRNKTNIDPFFQEESWAVITPVPFNVLQTQDFSGYLPAGVKMTMHKADV